MITEIARNALVKYRADIHHRNLSIARFLGWYQKDKELNIWFVKDEKEKDIMVWTPLYNSHLPNDELPFFHDLNQLTMVIETLRDALPFSVAVEDCNREKGKWYHAIFAIGINQMSCVMNRWNGGHWVDQTVIFSEYGKDYDAWRVGLFFFLSDIILKIQTK